MPVHCRSAVKPALSQRLRTTTLPSSTPQHSLRRVTLRAGGLWLAGLLRPTPLLFMPLLFAPLLFILLWFAPLSHAEAFNLDMRNTDMQEFIASVSKLTGKTIIVDQRVKGSITIRSPKAVSAEQLYEIFLVQLGVSGYSVVDLGNDILKVIPSQGAKLEGIEVQGDLSRRPASSEAIITRVVSVKNVEVNQLVPILRPLVDNKTGVIAPYPASNVIMITDRESNVRRLLEIITRVDKADTDSMEVIKLKNASAKEMARSLTTLIREQAKGEGSRNIPIVSADERTNSLLVRGDTHSRAYLMEIITKLDNEIETESNIQVRYLKYAKAKDLVSVLESISNSIIESEKAANQGQAAATRTSNVNIKAHEQTNTLVLSGSPRIIKNLEGVIDKLDIRRAQVLVEAVIVEMSEDRAKALGVQWLFGGDSNKPAGMINFSNQGASIAGVAAGITANNPATLAASLSGIEGLGVGMALNDGNFSFSTLIQMLDGDSDSNILSTPSLVTMDNEEASILVGREIPVLTGSTASSTNANPFQTIERKDVGIKLVVTPQINEGNAVQLKIQQEVSDLVPSADVASDVITNKREINTTVMVDDGATIVLGGLIDESISQSASKVPGLGDIPYLGRLFRSDTSKRLRRNLMVFLRPTIVRDAKTMAALSASKYGFIKAQQLLFAEKDGTLFANPQTLVLPDWTGMGPADPNLFTSPVSR